MVLHCRGEGITGKYSEQDFPQDERGCMLIQCNELAELSRLIRYWMEYNNRPTNPEEARKHKESLEDKA